jgi:putative ABC transport system permease protein
MSTEIPGKFVNDLLSIRRPAIGPESIVSALTYTVDSDFLKTYGMKIIAGRDFIPTDHYSIPFERGNPVILTELAANAIGFRRAQEAVGQEIAIGPNNDFLVVVVGIVKNFHQRSVKDGYNAILFKPSTSLMAEYLTIRMDIQNPASSIEHIEEAYAKTFPGNEFSYFFLDDFFDAQYAPDQKFQRTFGLFSILSVTVTCLGLFGLSTFTISQRNREIGIRKVFGATTRNIIYLFSFDFLRLILMANLLGLPIAYWLSTWWLQNFSFKTALNIGIFLLPSALLTVICLATVSFQVKAGTKSPVEALRLD